MSNPLLPEHVVVWNLCFGSDCHGTYDCDGRWIEKSDYGLNTRHGWEIDHIIPTALGGPDTYANKRPRHREGNSRAGGLVGAMIAKSPTNALHVPSSNTPIANMLAAAPPHSARGLEALANALAAPASHSARGLADALAKPAERPVGLFGGLANALAERSRAAEEPPVNALYGKPRGLF